MYRRLRLLLGLVLVLLVGTDGFSVATAQRLMVVSQTRNAIGEACRLQLHSVDLDLGTVQPGALPLSGTHLSAPLLLDRQHAGLLVSSGPPWVNTRGEAPIPPTALASFRIAPLAPWPEADNRTAPGWREWTVGIAEDQRTLSNLLVTAQIESTGQRGGQGALATRPWPPEGLPRRIQAAGVTVPLPLNPLYALPVAPMNYIVLGAATADEPLSILLVDLANETISTPETFPITHHATGLTQLRGAVLDAEKGNLWILFSALVLGAEGVEPTSWLYVIDSTTLAPTGPPLEISGVGVADDQPLTLDGAGACWVATHTPGTDFGHITHVGLAPESRTPEQRRHWALVGVHHRLRVIPDVGGEDVIVSHDHTVAYWPQGVRKGHQRKFDAPVATVQWTEAGVVMAEGNRIHRLTIPECTPEATVTLQSGWAIDVVSIPANALPAPDADGDGLVDTDERKRQTKADDPDSDGDGTPDGRDPHPNAPSPRLQVPADVVIPYTAVGRELRALQIESHGAPNARWQISFDSKAIPWLQVHPRDGRGSGNAFLGVNPERFDPAGVVAGTLTVTLTGKPKGNRPGYHAAGSPATVQVRVAPPRDPLPTILWLWPESADKARPDPALSELHALMANAPYYFSHVARYGPVSEPLAPYSIIILGARAAAEGALTQKALLNYLNEGGAVLFLGTHLEGDHYRDLSEWLRPLDIQVDTSTPLSGRFPTESRKNLLRNWSNYTLAEGCQIIDQRAGTQSVRPRNGKPNQVIFSARTHGYGRIALMAAATPLRNDALANDVNRAFAFDLFYWLRRAGYDVSDRDGDGLLDDIEDLNANSAVDRSDGENTETDGLDPDTDDDGIPDGMEDTNRNGVVDAGETDPRKADSDSDGTNDGADATPTGVSVNE